MTSSDKEQASSLIPLPDTASVQVGRGEPIASRVDKVTLETSRRSSSLSSTKLFRIGDFELREPDYRQVFRWSKGLKWSPEDVLECLASLTYVWTTYVLGDREKLERVNLRIENGFIRDLVWDGKRMPLDAFEWEPGLKIRQLAVLRRMPQWPPEEALTSLVNLAINKLGLTKFDLSPVPGLRALDCSDNRLTELDLSPVPGLGALDCGHNQLAKFDLSPVPGLSEFDCRTNQLAELDLSPTPGLRALYCSDNQLTELDLSPVRGLSQLYCSENQLTELDLSPVPGLRGISCSDNQITELDLSPVPGLDSLICRNNQLTKLDLSPVPRLRSLFCSKNQLTELDLRPLHEPPIMLIGGNARIIR